MSRATELKARASLLEERLRRMGAEKLLQGFMVECEILLNTDQELPLGIRPRVEALMRQATEFITFNTTDNE